MVVGGGAAAAAAVVVVAAAAAAAAAAAGDGDKTVNLQHETKFWFAATKAVIMTKSDTILLSYGKTERENCCDETSRIYRYISIPEIRVGNVIASGITYARTPSLPSKPYPKPSGL